MASKKSKMLKVFLLVVAVGAGGYFAWIKFLRKDSMGGRMTLDATPKGGSNVVYDGKKVGGWIAPGTLKVTGGYFTGTGDDGGTYQYRESGWIKM